MMFTDDFQLLGSAKWSNHGDFGSYDMIDHSGSNGMGSLAADKLGRWGGGSSPIGEYLYQTNGYASLNGIAKLDSVRQLRANVDYTFEQNHNSFSTQTLYFADGQNISVSEHTRPFTRVHRPSLSLRYELNAPDLYFQERLNVKAQIEENECPVNDNMQRREAAIFQVSNSVWNTVRTGRHKLSLNSDISFNRSPSVLLEMTRSASEGSELMSQRGQSTTLTTSHSTSLSLRLTKKWKMTLPLTLNADYKMIEMCQRQRVGGWKLTPSTNISTSWKSANTKAYMSAGMNVRWLYMNYQSPALTLPTPSGEGQSPSPLGRDWEGLWFFAEPHLKFNYTFSGTSELSLISNVSNSAGDILDLLTVPIQTSYRSTSAASGVIGKSQSWDTTISYKKQVPFSYFTFAASATWGQGKRNVLSAQTVSGTAVENASIFRDSHTRNANATVSLSKNILPIYTKLSLTGNANWGSSEQMSQGKLVTSYASGYHASASADVTPVPWMEVSAAGNYSKSFTRFNGEHRSYDGLGANGSLAFFPTPLIELRGNCRYIRSLIADNQYKHSSMLSASAQYKAKRAVWKLALNNLLNTRQYTYTVQSGPDRYIHSIDLIGRTVMLTCKMNIMQH